MEDPGSPRAARGRTSQTLILLKSCVPARISQVSGPCTRQPRTRTADPNAKTLLADCGGPGADSSVCKPQDRSLDPGGRAEAGEGRGGGCRQARAAGRRQARGDERRAPGEGAAPGDRLQPRRAPRPRPAPPPLPGAEAAARAGAALIALGPGTQPARSRDNLAPGGMTIRPNGTTSLPEE